MNKNIKKFLLMIVLILTLVLNVKYVYAEDLNFDEDIVIDTDLEESKTIEVNPKQENIIREEVKETPSVQESKSESVTKAQDDVQVTKTEEQVTNTPTNAPNAAKAGEVIRDGEAPEEDVIRTKIFIYDMRSGGPELANTLTYTIENKSETHEFQIGDLIEGAAKTYEEIDPTTGEKYKYTFEGWFLDEGKEKQLSTSMTAYTFNSVYLYTNSQTSSLKLKVKTSFKASQDITLYASWKKELVPQVFVHYIDTRTGIPVESTKSPKTTTTSISYNTLSSLLDGEIETQNYCTSNPNCGSDIAVILENDKKYIFNGWYTEAEGGDLITSNTSINIVTFNVKGSISTRPTTQPGFWGTDSGAISAKASTSGLTESLHIYIYAQWVELEDTEPKARVHVIDTRYEGISEENENIVKVRPNKEVVKSLAFLAKTGSGSSFQQNKIITKENVYVFKGYHLGSQDGELITTEAVTANNINISTVTDTTSSIVNGLVLEGTESVENDDIYVYIEWEVLPVPQVHFIDVKPTTTIEVNSTYEANYPAIGLPHIFKNDEDYPYSNITNEGVIIQKEKNSKNLYTFEGWYSGLIENYYKSDLTEEEITALNAEKEAKRITRNYVPTGDLADYFVYIYANDKDSDRPFAISFQRKSYDSVDKDIPEDVSIYAYWTVYETPELYFNCVDNVSTASGSWHNPEGGTTWYEHTFSKPDEPGDYKFQYWDIEGTQYQESEIYRYDFEGKPSGTVETVNAYAYWRPGVRIQYYDEYNTGDLIEETKYSFDKQVVTTNIPTKRGYDFAGWVDENNQPVEAGVTEYGAPEVFFENKDEHKPLTVKLYATWTRSKETITITKNWVDSETKEYRPSSVNIKLTDSQGNEYSYEIVAPEEESENNNTWMLRNVEIFTHDINGNNIYYTLSEEEVPSYSTEINGYTITNRLKGDSQVKVFYRDIDTGAIIADTVTLTGKIDQPYASEQKDIDKYQFVEVYEDGAPASGVYKDYKQEVTYLYEKAIGEVIVHLVDYEDGEYISEDVNEDTVEYRHPFTGEVGTSYTEDIANYPIDIPGYKCIGIASTEYKGGADNNLQLGVYTREGKYSKEVFDIFYVYKKLGTVTVHHYLEGTTTKVAEDEILEDELGATYATDAKTEEELPNYTLVTSPDHNNGTYGEEPIEIIYYYAKKDANVIIHYIDTEGNKIAEDDEKPGKVGERYNTSDKVISIDGYFYLAPRAGDKEVGVYTIEPQEVYYVYMKGTYIGPEDGLKGDIFIRKENGEWNTENEEVYSCLYENDVIDIGTSLEIAPIKQQLNDTVAEMYKLIKNGYIPTEEEFRNIIRLSNVHSGFTTTITIPKGIDIDNATFNLLALSGEDYESAYNGMYELIPVEINPNEDGSTTVVIKMVLKDQTSMDSDNYSTLYEEFNTLATNLANEPDYLTFIIYGAKIAEGVKNQTLTISGNVNGSLDADANGTVSVETPFGTMNVPLPDRHFRFDWGSTQNHNEPHWNDAKDATITDENNHSIQLTLQVLAHGKVITHYVDKETGDKISEDDGLYKVYSTNDPYETTKKEITDYTYDSDTGNTKGVFEENDIDVTYYYIKNNGTVTVHYRNQKTGEDLPYTLEVLTGKIGTGYETEKKEFPNTHYEYKEVVGDTIGTYSSTPIEVIYYYVWKQGTVIVHHVDAETNEELTEEPDKFTGDVDSEYTALSKDDIEHYTLTGDSGNRIGEFTENQKEVTFYYTRNTGKVIVNYVDEEGNLLDTVEESGKVEIESYTTELKSFENYTLDEGQEVQTVTYTEDTQTITYTYSKNKGLVTVRYVAEDQAEELDTIVIDTKKIGETYTSAPNEYDHYTLAEIPANANGTVEATPIEVIYNYVRNTGKIIVHYVDADTNEELDTVEKTGKVETGSYTTEIKPFENYTPVEEYEPETVTFTEETQEITYKYTKNNGLVIVHYVDKDTNEDIETVRITDKKIDEAYTTEQKEFTDYHYVDKSNNTVGVVTATETNVYYYYEKDNGTVIVHHIGIKDETEKELDSESFPGKIGDNYTTSSKEFEHYTLDQTRIPEPGKFVSGSINVYYYYTWNKGQVVVHYVADDQDEELETVTLDPANVDSKYETEAKEFTSYRLTGDSGNRIGIVTEKQTDVYYYYTRLESDVTVHYVDADTNEELDTEYGHGKVGETYTLINKKFENYTLVSAPEGETVTYTEEPIELTYTYKKNSGSITVYYKDLFTGKEIEGVEVKNTSGYVDQKYNAEPIDIEGYKFIRTEGNEELVGNYPNGENYVFTHYYQRVGKVVTHYYEIDSTTKVSEDVEQSGPINEIYMTTPAEDVEGYSLVETPENASGRYSEELTEVIYYYQKLGNVITHFLNTNGEEVADSNTQSGVVGSDYTTEPAEVEGYELVGTPQNATGIYAKEDTHVYYIYGEPVEPTPEINYGKVIVHYIDEEGNKLIDNITLMGEVGTEYNAPEIPIAGYVLIDAVRINTQRALLRSILPEGKPNIGLFEDEPFQVNMIYRKVEDPKPETGRVIVLYTDTEGYELQKPIEIPGNVGEDYITSQPKIDGYRIKEVIGEKRGTIAPGTTYVEYIYEKIEEEPSEPSEPENKEQGTVIAYFVDENGNSIADPMIIAGTYGTTYVTYQKVIPGYTGTSIPENRVGKIEQELLELVYTYAKNEETEEQGSSCEGSCNCCNTCNCNNGENQQPQIIININNENNSDNHSENNSENHNDNSSDNHSENTNDNNVNNEVNNDTNVENNTDINNENNTDVNNENNNQDETNVNIENNPVNNNDNNTTVETGDTNVDVTTGDTNVENNTTTGDTNVTTGDVTTGDTTVTTGDQTVNTGDTNVTTGDTTIENNPTVENNTNVETGDTTVDTGDINNNVEAGDTNVTTGDTTIENNPTNNVENNTDVDASSNNNNENTNNSESNPVIDLDNSSNSESNPTIENNPTINVEVNPTIDNTSNSESNPTVDNSSNSDSSSSSESNPNVENNTTIENNPTNTNETNPTNNVDVNPTIDNENNPSNNNEGSNTNDNNPTNNNEGSNTNTNENNNSDTCENCTEPKDDDKEEEHNDQKPDQIKGTVLVHYQDINGNILASDEVIEGFVGEQYTALEKYIAGYELSEIKKQEPIKMMMLMAKRPVIGEENQQGSIEEGITELIFIYTEIEQPEIAKLVVKYIDENGNSLEPTITKEYEVNTNYSTDQLKFKGYELDSIEGEKEGQITPGTTYVIYKYKEVENEKTDNQSCCNNTIIVNCNTCPSDEIPDEDCPDKPEEPKTGIVEVTYIDTEGNVLKEKVTIPGYVGDEYNTTEEKFENYTLSKVVGNSTGNIIEGKTEVVYIYNKVKEEEPKKGEVIARYIDTLGNKISGNITFKGTIGKTYETFAKILNNYEFIQVVGKETGVYTEEPIEVVYIYKLIEQPADDGEVKGETKTQDEELDGTGSTRHGITPPNTEADSNILGLFPLSLIGLLIITKKEK